MYKIPTIYVWLSDGHTAYDTFLKSLTKDTLYLCAFQFREDFHELARSWQ